MSKRKKSSVATRESARWVRVQELFHAAADLPAAEQRAFLESACGGDEALRASVEQLLSDDAAAGSIIDRNVGAVAKAILSPANDTLPAQAFGAYRLTRLIGEGGMGVVYLAERADLESQAAVKILRDAWLSPARRDRFLAEQRTLAQLNHPSIARLFDAGTLADGTPWIAMEYVDGVALDEYCRDRKLDMRARVRLIRDVCDAVRYAHQLLVIHRDLKPSNVLVRSDGTVKLLDFGIAKQLSAPADDDERVGATSAAGQRGQQATRTGLRMMTPAYAAPEQVLGQAVGAHTDAYALGVMLYELLTGARPFELDGMTPSQAATTVVETEPVRPSVRAQQAKSTGAVTASRSEWEELDLLCITAMHKDPARRYRSADALLRDIDHFLASEPLEAHPDSAAYRTTRFVRRHARAVAAASVLTLAIALLVTFYTVRLTQARDRALAESVRAHRIQQFISGIFQGGDDAAGPADSLRVITLLDQAVAEARALDREPAVQADLYLTLGRIYRQLGQFDRADSLLTASLAQWQRLEGSTGTEWARASVALADLRTDQARYDDAERGIRAALTALQHDRADNRTTAYEARVALGRSLTERGEHARAVQVLDSVVTDMRANAVRDNAPDVRELLDGIGELASAHFYAGNYDASDSLNREVLAMSQRTFGDRHPRVAEDLMNLGATEQERGNYTESERYFRDALERTVAFHGEAHYRTAGNLVYLGRSLLLQGRYPEAKAAFERSLSIRERVFGASHPTVANTLNELGSLAIKENRYDDAERAFVRVRAIYQAAYPGRSFKTGVASGNLADTYLYRQDYKRAEPLYRDALAHYIATQGPEHLNTGIGYIKLGRCLMRSGRFAESVSETQRGYTIVAKVASANVSFLQAARLDLSIALDSLGAPALAAKYRAERERYLEKTP